MNVVREELKDFMCRNRTLVLILLLCLLWIPWLGETPFYTKGEPREAIVAVSMIQSGDWILPVNAGWEYPFKPPMLAWIIAVFAALFNGGEVTEFISRLPSALAAISMIVGVYFWIRRYKGEKFAFTMALVTATSFEVFRAAMACRLDMLLTAYIVGAMICLLELSRASERRPGLFVAAAVLMTCAVLTKGPVGALLPCLAVGIYRLIKRENFFRVLGSLGLIAIISFIVPALWYYEAWLRGGDAFFNVAYEENIGRLLGTMSYESHLKPFWYNFLTVLSGMLPWTVLVAMALPFLWKNRTRRMSDEGLFALVMAVAVIGFYCLPASKRSVYLLPAYPFMAYGVTVVIERIRGEIAWIGFGWIIGFVGILAPLFVICESVIGLMPDDLHVEGFMSYLILAVTIVSAAWWLFYGARHSRRCLPVIYMMFLCYAAALMPALFRYPLKTAEATEAFEQIKMSDSEIRTIGSGPHADQVYWFNYYLNDRIRRVADIDEAEALPSGSIVFLPASTDLEPIKRRDTWMIYMMPFNPDTRKPVALAIKK